VLQCMQFRRCLDCTKGTHAAMCNPFTSLIVTAAEVVLLVAALGVGIKIHSGKWRRTCCCVRRRPRSPHRAISGSRVKTGSTVAHISARSECSKNYEMEKQRPARAQQHHNRTIDRLHEACARERLWIFILLLVLPGCCFALARSPWWKKLQVLKNAQYVCALKGIILVETFLWALKLLKVSPPGHFQQAFF
jgi:hypothetical protein